MNNPECQVNGYWCPACTSILIEPDGDCHHDDIGQITDTRSAISEPELETILEAIFEISSTELEICLCVMDAGEATIEEIATKLNASRTTVSRHIDHLVDIGVLEPDDRVLTSGGRVTVYTTASPAVVRKRFKRILCHWTMEAVCQIDTLTEEKVREISEVWTKSGDVEAGTSTQSIFYTRESSDDDCRPHRTNWRQ